MRGVMRAAYLALVAGVPVSLAAQSLEQRVAAVGTGTVRMSFAAHPGVCGDGRNNIRSRQDTDEWEEDCAPQPVRVAVRLREQQVMEVRTYVGGRWRSSGAVTDLGTVRPQEAAAYFIGLAERQGSLSGDPVLPATLADSVVIWPALLRVARASTATGEARRNAIFWLGHAAGATVAGTLDSIVEDRRGDREVRRQAVFALSQRSSRDGVPSLIRIARSNPDPELRKTALFWLGQSEDPRALALFEEILR
jgi:HEAT repeat protein